MTEKSPASTLHTEQVLTNATPADNVQPPSITEEGEIRATVANARPGSCHSVDSGPEGMSEGEASQEAELEKARQTKQVSAWLILFFCYNKCVTNV